VSFIVNKKITSLKKYNNFLDEEFIFLHVPKAGGTSFQKIMEDRFLFKRPKELSLVGHFSLLETNLKLSRKNIKISNYLALKRDPLDWRYSCYNFWKNSPERTGDHVINELFNNISFIDYIKMLLSDKNNLFNSNLAWKPYSDYISYNFEFTLSSLSNINLFIYDMTNGFERFEKDILNLDKTKNLRINISKRNSNEKELLDATLLEELREFDKIPENLDINFL